MDVLQHVWGLKKHCQCRQAARDTLRQLETGLLLLLRPYVSQPSAPRLAAWRLLATPRRDPVKVADGDHSAGADTSRADCTGLLPDEGIPEVPPSG